MDLFRSEGSREMKKETQKKERNEGDGKMVTRPTGWVAHCENCWKELSSNEIDECWPQDEDEFIKDLKNQG